MWASSDAFFFLAMAHHQLGQKDAAREWYEKAVQRMEKIAPHDALLLRLRAEAAALIGVSERDALTATQPVENKAGSPNPSP